MIIKPSKHLTLSLTCTVLLLIICELTACGNEIDDAQSGTETQAQTQMPTTPPQVEPGTQPDNPGITPPEELSEIEEPDEQDASAERILAQIPYYGDKNVCRMTAMQALAYAEAINTADSWADPEQFYPALMDVAGDGVPLLFLLWESEMSRGYFLYGYENGSSYRIECCDSLTVVLMDGEILLRDIMYESSFAYYDLISFHRISNGAAELVSETLFHSQIVDYNDEESERFFINDDEVSRADFDRRYAELTSPESEIETLIRVRHTAYFPDGPFSELLSLGYSRDQAMQVFLDYADRVMIPSV